MGLPRIALITSIFVAGCGDDGPRVPGPVAAPNGPPAPAEDPGSVFQPEAGTSLGAGTARLAVEGAPIEIAGTTFRMLLARDVDGDGDRDAILLADRADALALVVALRDGGAFTATELDAAPRVAPCETPIAHLDVVAEEIAIASLGSRCATELVEARWAIGLGGRPRVLERFVVRAPADGSAPAPSVALRVEDQDGDGHPDLLADVRTSPSAAPLTLAWLDRPGGLARGREEPERTLAALATHASETLRRDPAAALAEARNALALHGALCREAGVAAITIGRGLGIQCGASAGAARAAAVEIAALARTGDLDGVLDAGRGFEHPSRRIGTVERSMVTDAIARAGIGNARRVSGELRDPAPDGALVFLNDTTLFVRTTPPLFVDVASGEAHPMGPEAPQEPPIHDASGRFLFFEQVATCRGHEARIGMIVRPLMSAGPGGAVGRTTLVLPDPAPAPCVDGAITGDRRERPTLLGWAPQGLVAARGNEVWVAPLDVNGRSIGDPARLPVDAPLPAPIAGAAVAADGRTYVVGHGAGVLLRKRLGTTRLLVPNVYAQTPGPLHAVAIAPNGRHAAFWKGTAVVLVDVPAD